MAVFLQVAIRDDRVITLIHWQEPPLRLLSALQRIVYSSKPMQVNTYLVYRARVAVGHAKHCQSISGRDRRSKLFKCSWLLQQEYN